MIQLGHSLLHLLDTESARRGLTRADMIECFKLAITENFRRRGKIVDVTVDDSDGEAVISAVETVLTGAPQAMYREVRFIPPFSPELLSDCIEDYVATRLQQTEWILTETKVVLRAEDHYLLEVSHPQSSAGVGDKGRQFHGQLAVLPMRSVTKRDSFRVGEAVWAIVKENVRTNIDGGYAEAWRNVQAPLIASRTESEFLTRMAFHLLDEPVTAVIHTDRGILIFPSDQNLQPLLSDNGKYKNMLQSLTGLERLAVARRPSSPLVHKRLIHAVREVAGLKYQHDFKLGCADPTKLPVIYTNPQSVKRLVGTGGHNLYFIKCVAGFQFEIKASFNMKTRSVEQSTPAQTQAAPTAHAGRPSEDEVARDVA